MKPNLRLICFAAALLVQGCRTFAADAVPLTIDGDTKRLRLQKAVKFPTTSVITFESGSSLNIADGSSLVFFGSTVTNAATMKTALSLGNVENTALSTWAGTTNLTTLGTIATGTWNATALSLGKIAQGGATNGQVLAWNGSAWAPATASAGLTDGDYGDITVGGTGTTMTIDAGTITSSKILDGTIVDADISASAAIANSKLANSSLTVGSTSISLGGTATTVNGLTLGSPVATTQLDLEADGVRLSASNGTLTVLGNGSGADENLTFDLNTTANKVSIGSGTGVTEINFGAAINLRLANDMQLFIGNDQSNLFSMDSGRKVVLNAAKGISITPGTGGGVNDILQLGSSDAHHDIVKIQRDGTADATYTARPGKQFAFASSYWNGAAGVEVLMGAQCMADTSANVWLDWYCPVTTWGFTDPGTMHTGSKVFTIQSAGISVGGNTAGPGEARLLEDLDNGSNYTGFKAPASLAADVLYEMPAADGTAGQVLKTNGSKVLSWVTVGGSVATDAIFDAKGDLVAGTGADAAARLAVGTDGQVLTADSTQSTGVKWSTVSGTGDVILAADNAFTGQNTITRSSGVPLTITQTSSTAEALSISAVNNDGNNSVFSVLSGSLFSVKGDRIVILGGNLGVQFGGSALHQLNELYGPYDNKALVLTDDIGTQNYLTINASLTTVAPSLEATGSDDDISLNLISKGTGTVQANGSNVLTAAGSGTDYVHPAQANGIASGRLTLTSATPVLTSSVTGAGTVYYTPFRGSAIALYTGSAWKAMTFSELSITLSTLSASTAYDVFAYDNSGTVALDTTAWTNATTRATALVFQDGVLVKSGATTRRYLGSFILDAAKQASVTFGSAAANGGAGHCDLWNQNNRVEVTMQVLDTTDSWDYTTNTWRAAHASNTNRVTLFIGLDEDAVAARATATVYNTTTNADKWAGIGLDSTSAYSGTTSRAYGTQTATLTPEWSGFTGVGQHYLQWLEKSSANGTTRWMGDFAADGTQSGLTVRWKY